MSLNGLDDPKIVQAYEASGEPGAWFVLKYASRDEIELLESGTGGLPELRKAVENYEDTSPLYGFLRYRRRVVIIKYLPEGCSRLIQARVAVHYMAVCERFSPYDTTFEITVADELRDSKLSAACSLHAASGSSASSSGSSRRRRLNEIAEEDEDELQQRASKRQSLTLNNEELTADGGEASPEPEVTLNSELATSPDQSKFSAPSTSDVPQFVGADASPASPTDAAEASRRMSTQSGRQESLNYAYYPYSKPKVKLGPRPSLEVSARPQTAGNFRPVSSIPAGLKMFGTKGPKKSDPTKPTKDADDLPSPSDELGLPASVPALENSEKTYFETLRPSTSLGVASLPMSPSAMSTATMRAGMSPEKARLMKAKKMREKKKKALAETPIPAIPAPEKTLEVEEEVNAGQEPEKLIEDHSSDLPDQKEEKRVTMIKTDSAIAIDTAPSATTASTDEASVLTQSDSRPTSPVNASSEADQSTKASSISESTDETVDAKATEKADGDDTPLEPETDSEPVRAEEVNPIEPVKEVDTVALESTSSELKSDLPAEAAEQSQGHIAHEMPTESDLVQQNSEKAETETPLTEAEPAMAAPVSRFSSKTVLSTSVAETAGVAPEESKETGEDNENNNVQIDAESRVPSTPPTVSRQYSVSKKDLRRATQAAASPSAVLEGPTVVVDGSAIEDMSDAQAADDHSEAETISASTKPKRKFAVEPIRTDLPSRPASRTETDFADDESLLNELQSATVEEAKPMLVAKTPVTPVFPSDVNGTPEPTEGASQPLPKSHMVRTVSNPVRGAFALPPSDVSQSSARSMSGGAAYLHKITQQQQSGANLAKKTNMGSGISQRIKALEMLSVEPKESKPVPTGRERPQSTFYSVKKGRTPSRSPSVLERATSFNIKPATPPNSQSRDVSPDTEKQLSRRQRERSGSVASRLSMFEPLPGAFAAPSGSAHHSPHNSPRGRPESISVTAKIIRDPEVPLDAPKDPSQFGHLDLKESPLVVDHQRAEPAPPSGPAEAMAALTGTKESIQERRMSRESIRSQSHERGKSNASRRSSLSVVKDFIKERRRSVTSSSGDPLPTPTLLSGAKSPSGTGSFQQSNSMNSRLSFSSHRSSFSKDRELVSSPDPSEAPGFDVSGDEVKSLSSEKRRSRAGRLMQRLSTLGSRGKISSPAGLAATVTEEEIVSEPPPPRPATTATSTAPAIVSYMGDVNVQFPDNLLWKRRNLCLDAAGYILLSISAQQQPTRAGAVQGTKRYHLSDFRRPYAPDVEVQELPNSVVLDFMEGSGLQFACEDRVGQANVLQILQDAHAKHALMFQV